MTMRTDFADGTGTSGSFGFLPYLRIAVPSWRAAVKTKATVAVADKLSREEVVALFDGDLKELRRKRRKLTETEKSEQDLASRIRSALYSA